MDFLDFPDVSFLPNSSIGQLCEDLNTIVGQGIWYNRFQVQNTKWLWLVNIVTAIISDSVICCSFGLFELCRWNPKLSKTFISICCVINM